jgi:hypothetical protein
MITLQITSIAYALPMRLRHGLRFLLFAYLHATPYAMPRAFCVDADLYVTPFVCRCLMPMLILFIFFADFSCFHLYIYIYCYAVYA